MGANLVSRQLHRSNEPVPKEARELAMQDPAVQAGWFEVVVDRWLVKAVPQTVGNRVDLDL